MVERIASDRGQVKITVLIGTALLLLIALAAAQLTLEEDSPVLDRNITLSRAQDLAALNNKQLDDYAAGYLERNNNFDDLEYVAVNGDKHPVRMMIGNRQDDLKGFLVTDKRFAVQLMACDWEDRVCAFRINGVATGAMKTSDAVTSEFILDSPKNVNKPHGHKSSVQCGKSTPIIPIIFFKIIKI